MPLQRKSTRAISKATAKQRMLKELVCSDAPEQALRYQGYRQIAGVDEVGRGALFGPVVAAAVILPLSVAALARAGLKDSKQMLREDREALDRRIRKRAVAISIAAVDAETIDRINIYQASRLAMLEAVAGLSVAPDHLIIDALRIDHPCAQTRLFYGDALCLSIAAASVIAKVYRDAMMRDLHETYPQYGLASHKGYATPEHKRALDQHGPTPLHRRSFAPVWKSDPNKSDRNAALDEALDSDASLDLPFDLEIDLDTATETTAWGLRLLCIVAHPDDECFAFGGALALAAERGVEISVVCLTDGQAASHRGASTSAKDLGRMRRAEFEASCKVLGVTHTEVLDYQDAQLEHANFSALAEKLVARIRAFRPHVIVTFGGEGALNSHPDHCITSYAATSAFHWASNPKRFLESGPLWLPQKLFYLTTNFFMPDRHKPAVAPWTLTLDIRSVVDKKNEAFRQHTSQAPLMHRTEELFLKHGNEERYILAATIVPQPAALSTDMFEGVGDS